MPRSDFVILWCLALVARAVIFMSQNLFLFHVGRGEKVNLEAYKSIHGFVFAHYLILRFDIWLNRREKLNVRKFFVVFKDNIFYITSLNCRVHFTLYTLHYET